MCGSLIKKIKFIENTIIFCINNLIDPLDVPIVALIFNENDDFITYGVNDSIKKRKIYGHAEINAIQNSLNILKIKKLNNYKIVITLEPCVMCLGAILQAGIKMIYYYIKAPKTGFVESNHNINMLNFKTKLIKNSFSVELKHKISNFFGLIR